MTRRSGSFSACAAAAAIGVCMLVSPFPGHLAGWVVPAAVAGGSGAAMLAVVISRRAFQHSRLHRQLLQRARTTTIGNVEIKELVGFDGPFVAGLVHPNIFCSCNLGLDLAADELSAVLLHERYHQLDRAPAKLVALDAVGPLVGWLDIGRAWLARQIAALEIAADRYALAHGASSGALARALFKLQPEGSAVRVGIGFSTAADLRLRALLDDAGDASAEPSAWLVIPIAVAAVCFALVGVA